MDRLKYLVEATWSKGGGWRMSIGLYDADMSAYLLVPFN